TTNARIIAATNANLGERVTEGKFREDLYYRLQVVTVHMPTLRERKEDLPDLVQTLLIRINKEMRQKVTRVAMDVIEAFYAYDWPGNVRELENILMKSVALCHGDIITLDLLPEKMKEGDRAERDEETPAAEQSLQDIERTHVARVLKSTNWHRGNACEILGVSRPRLRRLIQQYELCPPDSNTNDEETHSEQTDKEFLSNER
ncbi:MAG: sigma 54-interacting transcriptional regulator, partial [Pseudomonadota bacterium]